MNDKIIQARISTSLEQKLVLRATVLKIGKSSLVRKCIEEHLMEAKNPNIDDILDIANYLSLVVNTSRNLQIDAEIIQKEVEALCQIIKEMKNSSQSCVG